MQIRNLFLWFRSLHNQRKHDDDNCCENIESIVRLLVTWQGKLGFFWFLKHFSTSSYLQLSCNHLWDMLLQLPSQQYALLVPPAIVWCGMLFVCKLNWICTEHAWICGICKVFYDLFPVACKVNQPRCPVCRDLHSVCAVLAFAWNVCHFLIIIHHVKEGYNQKCFWFCSDPRKPVDCILDW